MSCEGEFKLRSFVNPEDIEQQLGYVEHNVETNELRRPEHSRAANVLDFLDKNVCLRFG